MTMYVPSKPGATVASSESAPVAAADSAGVGEIFIFAQIANNRDALWF